MDLHRTSAGVLPTSGSRAGGEIVRTSPTFKMAIMTSVTALLVSGVGAADTFTPPTDDAWIWMARPDNNYGGSERINVRTRYGHPSHGSNMGYEGLVRFDLSSIPPGSGVESATLYLYYASWHDTPPVGRELNCYRVTGDWDESTVTWLTRPGTAAQSTSASVVPSTFGWMDWDVTTDVQAFLLGWLPDYGWQLKDEGPWGWYDIPVTRFWSKEHGSLRPRLEVVLEEPNPVESTTWTSVKALFK